MYFGDGTLFEKEYPGDGMIATDAEGCILQMNPNAEVLIDWIEDETLGHPIEIETCLSLIEYPADHTLEEI